MSIKREVPDPEQLQLDPTVAPIPPLYGNENYVSDHQILPRPNQHHTREEWLAEATPAHETLDRGDHVSPRLIEMLFDDAFHVITDFVPATRAKKGGGDDDESDEKKRDKR